jgi:hypothetical protein
MDLISGMSEFVFQDLASVLIAQRLFASEVKSRSED